MFFTKIFLFSSWGSTLKLKIKKRKESRSPIRKKIRGVSDLRQSFGFHLKELIKNQEKENEEKIEEENDEEETPGCDTDEREKEFEKLKKLKIDSEVDFLRLQEKIISYYKQTDNEHTFIINYRNYLESINNQIRNFRQQLRISVVGELQVNYADASSEKVKQLTKEMESLTVIINQVNDNIYRIKNRTLKKAENILRRDRKSVV